jgi:hypothetical protein
MVHIGTANAADVNVSLLLQQGVYVKLPDTVTVSGFICSLFDIDLNVLKQQFQTLILNNEVVDRPDETHLNPGDTLILSGAMPGLVGAMLRSDSPLKSMRSTITSGTIKNLSGADERMVQLKLFNTVLKTYKGKMINNGFWVKQSGGN